MTESPPISTLRFREVQRFTQVWLWALLLPVTLGPAGLLVYGMVEQLVFGRPWGTRPMSDAGLWTFGLGTIALCLGIIAMIAWARLVTQVREDGLFIRFFPFHLRFHRIALEDVTDCRTVTYHPIREYGGWGIRLSRKGKAYNVRGDRGVRLEYRSGRHLLIGSQRPEELEEAVLELLAGFEGARPG
jgi:hypothetical protein